MWFGAVYSTSKQTIRHWNNRSELSRVTLAEVARAPIVQLRALFRTEAPLFVATSFLPGGSDK